MASSTVPADAVRTPSRPVRSSRQLIQSYNESTSEESSSTESDQRTTGWRNSTGRRSANRTSVSSNRPKRTTQTPRSYREPSSDEDLDRVISRYPEMVTTGATSKSSPRPPPSSTRQRAEASPAKRKRNTVQSPRKRRNAESSALTTITTDMNKSAPPWHTLPYHILFSIFLYAFHPALDSRHGFPEPGKQALGIALLCRAFAEPALSALYHTPVLDSLKAHKIIHLLSQPVDSLSVNYPTKVQELLIDVRRTLVYKTGPPYGYFDLCKLIQKVPHIKTLRLLDPADGKSLFIRADRTPRWNYPVSLFETLKTSNVRLHTFDWNSRYMDPVCLVETMLTRHTEAPFQTIRHLNLLHILSDEVIPQRTPEGAEEVIETALGTALCQLPNLQTVSFTDCTAVNDVLFLSLPPTLTSLTLDNCDEVGTSAFVMFLSTHGAGLRELVLKHNRHLNMSFMIVLKEMCPNLERLSCDFNMHNWPPLSNGMPHFKSLFKADEAPTWPDALQEIELVQLRQWDKPRAATLLGSLIDAAPNLKDLRKIVISATVHMGWQDRALFRRQWINILERTFLRKDKMPEPTKIDSDIEHAHSGTAGHRHSHRQSARIARQRISGVEDDEDEDKESDVGSDNEGSNDNKDGHTISYVQGMCDVVSLRIDNLRPADTQFNEDDFLDSEQSGDEDWDGEDWDPEDDRHAW